MTRETAAKTLPQLVDAFLQEQTADGTRRAYAHAVESFLAFSHVEKVEDLARLDRAQAEAFRNHLRDEAGRAKTYVNRQISALRRFCRRLLLDQVLDQNPFDLVARYKVARESRTVGLEEMEVKRLLEACRAEEGLPALRDRALLMTLYYECLRRSEASKLNRQDLRRVDGFVILRDTKTTDRDDVALREEVTEAIDRYFAALDALPHPSERRAREPVFVSLSNRSFGKRLSPSAILEIVQKRALEAGVETSEKHVIAHSLRHSSVTHMLDHGASVEETSAHSRHKDIRMIAYYDRKRKKRGAIAAAALPRLES